MGEHVWADFRKGDYGELGGWEAPEGSWTGVNMKVDRDGSICPRKGAVSLALTGLSGSAADPFAIDANIDTYSGSPIVFVLFGGGVGASFDAEASPAAAWTNYSNGATYYVQTYTPHLDSLPGFAYFGEAADPDNSARHRIIEVDHHAHTLTAIGTTDTYKGYRLAIYKDRLYKEVDYQDYLSTVKYSAGPDSTTLAYAFGNFADTPMPDDEDATGGRFLVGSKARIQRFLAWRDSLLIFKDTEVWEFRGPPSAASILRRLCSLDLLGSAGAGLFIPHHQQVMVGSDNNIWIAPNKGYRPVVFDGMNGREVEHVNLGRQGRHLIAPRRDGSGGVVYFDSLLPSGSGTGYDWHFDGKRWTKHLFPRPTMASRPSGTLSIWPRQGAVGRAFGTDHLFLVEQVSGGGYNQYRLPLATDGPGLENSPYERAGDGSSNAVTASFTLPVLTAPKGAKEIKVRRVTVIAEKWRTGGASTNHLDVAVANLTRWRTTQSVSSTASWDEANATAGSSTGDHTSQVIDIVPAGTTFSGAVELRFTNVRGLSIRAVVCEYDERAGVS